MKEVIHKKRKKIRRPTGYPYCVMRDGYIKNDDGPVKDHHGIWHFVCWEAWDGANRALGSNNPMVRRQAQRYLYWAKLRMEGRNINDD